MIVYLHIFSEQLHKNKISLTTNQSTVSSNTCSYKLSNLYLLSNFVIVEEPIKFILK